jgi:putative oxidoreductase
VKVTFDLNFKSAIRWLLAVLLIWAALSKIANLHEFHAGLLSYQLPLPNVLLQFTAIVLPWLEFICGVLLIIGGARRTALLWTAGLFAVFVLATGQAWVRGLDISCGCFNLAILGLDHHRGPGLAKLVESVSFAFFRALLLLAGTIYLLRNLQQRPQPSPALPT